MYALFVKLDFHINLYQDATIGQILTLAKNSLDMGAIVFGEKVGQVVNMSLPTDDFSVGVWFQTRPL